MQKKVISYINQFHMLERGDRLVLGVSGGADSICLLDILCLLREKLQLTLFVVHVNHGLRGKEADHDQQFTEDKCRQLGVSCRSVRVNVEQFAKEHSIGTEEAGRSLRYSAFLEEAKQQRCSKIAVAHHRNDNAETVLFRLFRGTGLSGLSGIAPVSKRMEVSGEASAMTVIRPLLCVTRDEIEKYLAKKQIEYCHDLTNDTDEYSRNLIRNRILPLAEKVNNGAVRNISVFAERLSETEEYLERQADILYWNRLQITQNQNGVIEAILFPIQQPEEPVLRRLALRKAMILISRQKKDIMAAHIEALDELFGKQVGSHLDLPYEIQAERCYEGVWLRHICYCKEAEEIITQTDFSDIVLKEAELWKGITTALPDSKGELYLRLWDLETYKALNNEKSMIISKNDYTKCFDYDRINDTIFIRLPRAGDCIQINPSGGSKLLKDYFTDCKVTREQRKRVPVIAAGNRIIWIPGMRTGEGFRVNEDTVRVLAVEWRYK